MLSLIRKALPEVLSPPLSWIAGAFGFVGKALKWAWKAAGQHPREAVIIALLAISGFLAWRNVGLRKDVSAEKLAHQADIDLFVRAQKEAERLAAENKLRIETKYKEAAHAADVQYQASLADARTNLDRYIAAHRVRGKAEDRSAVGQAAGSAQGGVAGLPQSLSTADILVSERDMQACDGAMTYALEAYRWAGTLEQVK